MPARDNKTTHRSLYTCEGCCANYRVAVGLLVGQGWERKRPTLSKWCIKPRKAVGLGLFLLTSFAWGCWLFAGVI